MGTPLTFFQLGEAASASKLMGNLNTLRAQGQAVIDALMNYRTVSLVNLSQQVQVLNARRQRANRIPAPFVAVDFVTTDLLDIDQTVTSATVRADAQAVTLKERPTLTSAFVLNQQFSTSDGVAEALTTDSSLYRVAISDGSTPTGTFTIQLTETLSLSVLSFDLAAMPSTPSIVVSASEDGVNFIQATSSGLNGERLTAWFSPMQIRYVTVAITPATPDTLGGSSYTFGLTGFSASQTQFELQSDLYTLPITFTPSGTEMYFEAAAGAGLTYFLNFSGAGWQEVAAGGTVTIPGTATNVISGVGMNPAGLLNQGLPSNAYSATVAAADDSTGNAVPVAVSLSVTDPNIAKLGNNYLAVNGAQLNYVGPGLSSAAGKLFTLSYVTGPLFMTVQLKVQISTSDRTVTPTFTGASLQEL